jgi:hypothetical protein
VRRRLALLPAALAVAAAAAVLLWPLDASGVTGNAVRPDYRDFGWFAYAPIPDHPTTDDLRDAGVRVPQDVVDDRRRLATALAATGLALACGGLAVRRTRRSS